jgi:hypothetical protein
VNNTTYLVDSEIEFKRVVIYEINHTEKIFHKILFNCILDCENFIRDNNCFPLVFYGLGYLSYLYNEFKQVGLRVSMDFDIYEWRMKLPRDIKNRTNLGYYYEMHGYELKVKTE